MNIDNIKSFLKESFIEDGIQKNDIYSYIKKSINSFHEEEYDYEVKKEFEDYINSLCNRSFFYEYSKNLNIKDDDEDIDDIRKEIEYENIIQDDLDDIDELNLVYDWYLNDRINFFLKEDINFFLDILDDI